MFLIHIPKSFQISTKVVVVHRSCMPSFEPVEDPALFATLEEVMEMTNFIHPLKVATYDRMAHQTVTMR